MGIFSMEIGTTGCFSEKKLLWLSCKSRSLDWVKIHKISCKLSPMNLKIGHQSLQHYHPLRDASWRRFSVAVSVEETSSSQAEDSAKDSQDQLLAKPSSNELKSLLADSERTKLIKKLSEANQQNRFLKRQLHIKEDALVNFKSELAVMELEMQALVLLAEEIAKSGIVEGTRKINGKYIQSHLLSRLKSASEKLKEQIDDVNLAQCKEVQLFWCGMAESVQVMGTFDGWSQGEHLSPDYTGFFNKFSTTLLLRPGRYEIKFLVDGEWHLSPEYPVTGKGLTENNLLLVD